MLNNPLRYTDPTGHIPVPGAYADDRFRGRASSIDPVQFAGDWETEYRSAVNTTARIIAQRIVKIAQADQAKAAERATLTGEDPAVFASSLSPLWGLSEKDAFKAVYGTVTFRRIAGNTIDGWAETHLDWAGNGCSRGQICYDSSMFNANPSTFGIMKNAAHELGHGIDQRGGRQARADLAAAWNTMPLRRTEGGFANGGGWQQNRAPAAGEVFADMFLGWTFNSWGTNDAGTARSQYMRANMPGVVALAVAGN